MGDSAWDESLETGNELIDGQHRDLNAFVHELREAGIKSDADYLQVLDEVMDFALVHFDAEEALMTEVGYPPDLTRQMVEQHGEFKSYARQCVLDFRKGDMRSVRHLQVFVEQFLKAHEVGVDKQLADWIRDNNLESTAEWW
jgi:hemerythrin